MNRVDLDSNARKRSQILPSKSYLDFNKSIDLLRKDGCLPEEISLAGDRLFAFKVEGDWVALAQRQDCRDWRGNRTFNIEVLDVIPASDFDRSSNRSTLEPASNATHWIAKVTGAIAPFIRRPNLPILVLVGFGAIAIFAVGYKYSGKLNLKMETDGDRVTGEVTIDGRQSQ